MVWTCYVSTAAEFLSIKSKVTHKWLQERLSEQELETHNKSTYEMVENNAEDFFISKKQEHK
jgi:hypothetical protein